MSQTKILAFLVNLVIFKPVTVMLCGLLGIPHASVVLVSAVVLFVTLFLVGKVKKRLLFLLSLSLIVVAWFFSAAFNEIEYIYNALFVFNYLLILMLCCLNRNFNYARTTTFWNLALIMTLMASFLDALFLESFTKFDGRHTLIGYDNPLWAARDLCVVVFCYSLTSKKARSFEVMLMLATMLFFLESRGVFLISILLYFIRFTPIYLASGLCLMTALFYLLVEMNPYSISNRLTEWSTIVSNVDNIPILGFGVMNYKQISFTSLGNYPHNFILELVLGYGIVGFLFSLWVVVNLFRLLLLKDSKEFHYLMAVPVIYVLAALSQGSLISGMLGLCVIPFGIGINKYLIAHQVSKASKA